MTSLNRAANRILFASLLLGCGSAYSQSSATVWFQGTAYAGLSDKCAVGPTYANTVMGLAQLRIARNNAVTTCDFPAPVDVCRDPATLVSADESAGMYVVRSQCSGALFTHFPSRIINPKQDPQSCCVSNGFGA